MIWLNDIEPYVVEWGRSLITAGYLSPGTYDERSIREVRPHELNGYDACHFFAGVGGWPLALRLAGWPTDVPVWTGSCPCQPFSVAGRRRGTADERHLWPDWFRLIKECRPPVIFGEQVASKDGYAWFDVVQADLESLDYACGMVVSPAAGYGAPHIRHRIYFMADAAGGRESNKLSGGAQTWNQSRPEFTQGGGVDIVADAPESTARCQAECADHGSSEAYGPTDRTGGRCPDNFWADVEWLPCTDGKARPTQPGLYPLAHGAPSRVGRLRAYGNAIVVPQAVEFVKAYMEIAALDQPEAGEEQP